MAKKKSNNSSSTTTKSSAKWSFQKILDFFAYIGTACIAIALILTLALRGHAASISNAFNTIGQCIAYILAMIMAAFWVRRKRKIGWLIAYIVFVVVIIVFYILNVAL